MTNVFTLTQPNSKEEFIQEMEDLLAAIKAGDPAPRTLLTLHIKESGAMQVHVCGAEYQTTHILGALTLAQQHVIDRTMG